MALDLLCAGAAKGLVLALEPAFAAGAGGAALAAQFGAVGAMRDALRAGAACDAIVLTEALIAELEASGAVAAGTRTAIGSVRTGVAVVAGAPRPPIGSAAALRAAWLGASALHVPDVGRSTAGAHVAAVLQRLGIAEAMAPRLRMQANGAAAMRALAESGDACAIGCTQVSEILYTPGLDLVGALPPGCELSTLYSAGVARGAADPALARRFIAWLASPANAPAREAAGFGPAC